MDIYLRTVFLGVTLLAPAALVHAQEVQGTLGYIIDVFGGLIDALLPIVFALALLAFFWGLAMYLLNFSGEEKDKKKGRDLMMYGVLVLFVAASVWGLVAILRTSFGVTKNAPITVPCVPGAGDCRTTP